MLMCFLRSFPGVKIGIFACVVSFFPMNLSKKYADDVVQVFSLDWCVSIHLVAFPLDVSTKLWIQSFSPMFFETSLTWEDGDSSSLYPNDGLVEDSFFTGARVGYYV